MYKIKGGRFTFMKKAFCFFVLLFSIAMLLCACQFPIHYSQQENTEDSLDENSNLTTSSDTSTTENDGDGTFLDWKSAYLNVIEEREEQKEKLGYVYDSRYALVYVDNDDIPELYVNGWSEAEGDLIYSYKNSRLIEQYLGRLFGGKYVERSGIVINQNGHMGQYYDNVYKLDPNGFSQILKASYTERYVPLENSKNDDYEIINEYFINGKTVSKDEYNAAINATVDLSQAVEFYENSVPYDVIKQQIADCK